MSPNDNSCSSYFLLLVLKQTWAKYKHQLIGQFRELEISLRKEIYTRWFPYVKIWWSFLFSPDWWAFNSFHESFVSDVWMNEISKLILTSIIFFHTHNCLLFAWYIAWLLLICLLSVIDIWFLYIYIYVFHKGAEEGDLSNSVDDPADGIKGQVEDGDIESIDGKDGSRSKNMSPGLQRLMDGKGSRVWNWPSGIFEKSWKCAGLLIDGKLWENYGLK